MARRMLAFLLTFLVGTIFGHVAFPLVGQAFAAQNAVPTAARKPIKIVHFYTGSDKQTHFDEITTNSAGDISKLLAVTGAEIHHALPGSVANWHTAPRRQYVITLSGHGEIEGAGGKKISVETGQIELAEDLTGQGHITRTIGNEDRVTLWLPLADQTLPP